MDTTIKLITKKMFLKQPAYGFIPEFNFENINEKIIWVISDTHFSHKNIVKGTSNWSGDRNKCRQFETVEEHDECIVNNINQVVHENDILIHCGDWSFGGRSNIQKFREQINCKTIWFLYGNHDEYIRLDKELQGLFSWCGDYLELKYCYQTFVFSHYPIGSWRDLKDGWMNIHGHCHGNYTPIGRQYDVCPEKNNFSPCNLKTICYNLSKIPIVRVDHH